MMRCFFYDIETNYEFDNNLNLEEAIENYYELSDTEGSFFGIITNKEEILQFGWIDKNKKWLVDIPYDVTNKLSLQKYADYEECIKIIRLIYQGISPKDIRGLEKVSI